MKILLGIFKESLYLLNIYPDLKKYPFDFLESDIFTDPLDLVFKNIDKVNKVIFCLDGLYFPINYEIYTYKELMYILKSPSLLKKTQFILNGELIKRELVIEQIKNKNGGKFEYTNTGKSNSSKKNIRKRRIKSNVNSNSLCDIN